VEKGDSLSYGQECCLVLDFVFLLNTRNKNNSNYHTRIDTMNSFPYPFGPLYFFHTLKNSNPFV